jgi:hypothetical protein
MSRTVQAIAVWCALSLLLAAPSSISSSAWAADWIGWVAGDDSYQAQWVKQIEQELNKKEYRAVFLNDPRTPQASVLRLLDRAAKAYNDKNEALASELVREAIEVLEVGVRKNCSSRDDINPIVAFIKNAAPVKPAA